MKEEHYKPGSVEDFDRFYRASHLRILYTMYGILGDHAAAEDCTQEAFAKAFKAWSSWKPDAPAEAWVHRIAVNVAFSYRRKARMREVGELVRRLGRPEPARDPAQVVEGKDLFRSLRKLSADQAAVIILRHHHGYTNRAIAFALGAPESTIASRLAKAKERLRKELNWAPTHEPLREGKGPLVTESESQVVSTDGPEG
jgi:RNA polymerase sigma-70 factor (ECF subfamily)